MATSSLVNYIHLIGTTSIKIMANITSSDWKCMFSSRECVRIHLFQLSQLACSTTRSKVTADLSFLLMRDIEMHSSTIACVWELYGAVRSHSHTWADGLMSVFCMCLRALAWWMLDGASRALLVSVRWLWHKSSIRRNLMWQWPSADSTCPRRSSRVEGKY